MSTRASSTVQTGPYRGWAIALPGALLALVLAIHGCANEPAALVRERKLASIRQLQAQLEASVEAEKSATLSTTDEDAAAFAAESKKASDEFETARTALRALVEKDAAQPQLDSMRELDDSWRELQKVDAKLLPMVLASTNRKAAKLSSGHAAQQLARLIDALTTLEGQTEKPAQLRELSKAKASALWVQTLHAPHIASALDAEMTEMEGRMRAWEADVGATLAGLDKNAPPASKDAVATAHDAWTEYLADTAKVIELSRANSNVYAYDLSLHDKRKAAKRVEAALASATSAVSQDASKASR